MLSKADEMFDEMGFDKIHDNRRRICYKRGCFSDIKFNHKHKWVEVNFNVDMLELKAIVQKCKELEWIK